MATALLKWIDSMILGEAEPYNEFLVDVYLEQLCKVLAAWRKDKSVGFHRSSAGTQSHVCQGTGVQHTS